MYSPPKAIYNTKATLLDTRNFVLQQLHPNGTNTLLWQSFDYPTDTLLPTQKLGVNHKTSHRWLVVSGFTNALPSPGAFSLEWEHVEQELIIRRRGKVCWRSGKLRNNRFEYISEDAQRRLKYTLVSNRDENSFSFTTAKNEDPVRRADLCYGYNNTDGGCQRWQDIPKCRNPAEAGVKQYGTDMRFHGSEDVGSKNLGTLKLPKIVKVGEPVLHERAKEVDLSEMKSESAEVHQ
ncbi:G-type lectin S-receptor-like serine/threonine-protein [Vigna angularis]|uniref:G-type lectin S-receptor-like serine/threonine-protein n=1 Tax=Phaseolus angularis TaxID=3914 RepID=A0A8T0KBX3_PHAAN|nr:G-type lectin S-receptor-like serine/threonine-protein [Vigna angularis]